MSTGDGVERVLQVDVGEAHDLSARTAVPARLRPGRGPRTDATAPARIPMRDPVLAQRGGRHLRESASLHAGSGRDPFLRHGLTARPGTGKAQLARGLLTSPRGSGATPLPCEPALELGAVEAPVPADLHRRQRIAAVAWRSRAPTSAGCRAAARRRWRSAAARRATSGGLGGSGVGERLEWQGHPERTVGARGMRVVRWQRHRPPDRRSRRPTIASTVSAALMRAWTSSRRCGRSAASARVGAAPPRGLRTSARR